MSTKVREESRFETTPAPNIYRHRGSGMYWIRGVVHDPDLRPHRVDRSLKTDKFNLAKERAQLIRNKIGRKEEVKAARHTFDEAFDLVVKIQKAPGKAEKTTDQATEIIDYHLRRWFKEHCPFLTGPTPRYKDGFEKQYEEVWTDYQSEAAGRKAPKYLKTEEAIEAWLKEHPDPRKLEHDRRYLVMTLKRAQRRGWITREFEKGDFDLNEVSEPIGRYLEDEEVEALLKAAQAYPKLYLQVRIALQLGMRLREILHLNKEEVDLRRAEIDLNPKRLKTRRRREVPIPIAEDLLPAIRSLVQAAEGPYLFPAELHNVAGRPVDPNRPQNDNSFHWDKVREATEVDARFHDLRHTAITNLLIAGVPDIAVRKICGVSEVTMRRIYAHIESKLKNRFREALNGRYSQA